MNYGNYDAICCKRCFYLLICNELLCIDQGNQLLIITNTINIITFLQPSNLNVFLHGYFLQCKNKPEQKLIYIYNIKYWLKFIINIIMSRKLLDETLCLELQEVCLVWCYISLIYSIKFKSFLDSLFWEYL